MHDLFHYLHSLLNKFKGEQNMRVHAGDRALECPRESLPAPSPVHTFNDRMQDELGDDLYTLTCDPSPLNLEERRLGLYIDIS